MNFTYLIMPLLYLWLIQCMHSIWLNFHSSKIEASQTYDIFWHYFSSSVNLIIQFKLWLTAKKLAWRFMIWKPCFSLMFLLLRCWRIFLMLPKLMWGPLHHCIQKWLVLLFPLFSFFVSLDLQIACQSRVWCTIPDNRTRVLGETSP